MDTFREINIDQLDKVTGGSTNQNGDDISNTFVDHFCKGICNRNTKFMTFSGGRCICTQCGWGLT